MLASLARRTSAAVALLVALALPAAAELRSDQFTAQATLTSDYVYRGLSQSREDPAIQGGFHYQSESGFFAGIWASSVDFPSNRERSEPRDLEVDYFLGYALELTHDWGASAQLTRYTYPGDDPAFDYDYDELALSVQFRDHVGATVHLSNDLFGLGERATVYEVSGRLPIGDRLEAMAGAGLFDLDKVIGDSYAYWNLGLAWPVGQFVFDLAYIGTSSEAERLFGAEIAGSRLVLSLTAYID